MPDVFVSQPPVSPNSQPISDSQPVVEPLISSLGVRSHRQFSAFRLYPDDVNFETKDKEEQIILLLRQHPIVNVKWIIVTLMLLTGPTLLGIFGIFSFLPIGFSLVLSLAWYLVTSCYAIESFLSWYFNVYFVTNQRIIDVDFFNLIDKRVSDAEIGKIQDVSYSTNGVVGTMLNFGNVFIQTAAEVSEFKFESVPNPEKVTKIIDDLMQKV
jgi:hypothetical protein